MFSVVGDPHCTPNNLDDIGKLFDILEDLGNDVIILGDLLDTKEIVRGRCLNFLMYRLGKSKLHFYIHVGNHDWFNHDCQEHSLEPLKALPNVTVVDRPTRVNLGGATALMLPYFDNLEAFRKELKEGVKGTDVVFMHQGVVGFDYGNGHVADGNGHGEITTEDLKNLPLTISGHFHKYAKEGKFTFLGTPFSHSFGETDQVKYIGLYNPDEDSLELLETPFPRHRTFRMILTDNPRDDERDLKSFLSPTDYWRVQLEGTEMQIKALDQSKFPSVKFLDEPTDVEQVETNLKDTDSNEQKFLTWAKEIKGLDDETIKLGLEILGEAR